MTATATEAATPQQLREALFPWLASVLCREVEVEDLTRLPGGASQEAWGLTCAEQRLVLRRDLGGRIYDYGVDREGEYRVLQAAARAGVRVPRPIAYSSDLLGRPGFVMERLDGEAIGRRVVGDPRFAAIRLRLARQLAENLAAIHRLPLSDVEFLPRPATGVRPSTQELTRMRGQLDAIGEPHPALELALHWLARSEPDRDVVALVHGDFRTGNFLVTSEAGLTGILDWEYVHLGDPIEDLGWFCARAWRFGAVELEAGGLAGRDSFVTAYEQAGGGPVDPDVLTWWELFANLRWAVGSLAQAQRHLTGVEASIELASLGRICAEMELEVLRLLDEVDP